MITHENDTNIIVTDTYLNLDELIPPDIRLHVSILPQKPNFPTLNIRFTLSRQRPCHRPQHGSVREYQTYFSCSILNSIPHDEKDPNIDELALVGANTTPNVPPTWIPFRRARDGSSLRFGNNEISYEEAT